MISLEKALEIAREFLECDEIGKVLEGSGYWIVYKKTEEIEVGGYGALISMERGDVTHFILPSNENFKLLANSKDINFQFDNL